MASDDFQKLVYEFLVRAKAVHLADISSAINDDLRRSAGSRDPDRSGEIHPRYTVEDSDEYFDSLMSEDIEPEDEDEGPLSSGRREIPVRRWIFEQTERLTEQVGNFGRILSRFLSEGGPYPMLSADGELLPINPESRWYRRYRPLYSIVPVKAEVAADKFASGYSTFVGAVRNAAPAMPRGFPSHLHFTLRSAQRGYRVHSTPLYWMSPTVFGSARSTPVKGYLPPGIYRFGGDHATRSPSITWDNGQHSVTPANTSSRVNAF